MLTFQRMKQGEPWIAPALHLILTAAGLRITSYINNLHPQKEKPLYRLVEKLISSSIPLWNMSLAHFRDDTFRHTERINYNYAKYDPPEPDRHAADYYEKLDEWQELPMKVIRPEPPDSFTPLREPRKYSLKKEYGERGLQVIVKLANIELTPEKPEYDGGSWHIEGQMVRDNTSSILLG